MANDEILEPRVGPGVPGRAVASPNGTNPASSRGRHDIVEEEDSGIFWPEVDGMLTGEFSSELGKLVQLRQQPLGVGDDGPKSAGEPAPVSGSTLAGAPAGELKETDPRSRQVPEVRAAPQERSAPGIAENNLSRLFNDTSSAVYEPPEEPGPSLFDALQALPELDADHEASNRIRWTGEHPEVQEPISSENTVNLPVVQAHLGAPIINLPTLPNTPKLSTPSAEPPVTLEHSTVVDPRHGPPPGSSFLDETNAFGGGAFPDAEDEFELVRFDRERALATAYRGPDRIAPIGGARPFDVVRDLFDRRWVTTALIASVALMLGVIGWVIFASGRPSNTGLVTATSGTGLTTLQAETTEVGVASTTLPATAEQLTTSSVPTIPPVGPTTIGPTSRAATTRTTARQTTAAPTTAPTTVATTAPTPAPTTAPTTRPTTTTTRPATTTTTTQPTTTTTQPATTTTQPTTTTTTTTTAEPTSTGASASSSGSPATGETPSSPTP